MSSSLLLPRPLSITKTEGNRAFGPLAKMSAFAVSFLYAYLHSLEKMVYYLTLVSDIRKWC